MLVPVSVTVMLLQLAVGSLIVVGTSGAYCQIGQPCWPSPVDIQALAREIGEGAERRLVWNGPAYPRVSAVPIYSPKDQPLYGLGSAGLKAVYQQKESDREEECFVNEFHPEYCLATTRNNPPPGSSPGVTVFPVTAEHIQAAVRFGDKHNMCISVAGTGHDFLGRHSCTASLFIRTTLMKDVSWGENNETITLGPGIVFSEAHEITSKKNRYISSGWGITVGVVGWSTGGGHGPHAPSSGLGVDNIVSADIVLANGTLVTASKNSHQDLWWALRGGGGSTWGVLSSITLKTHPNPGGGFTVLQLASAGSLCSGLEEGANSVMSWMLSLDEKWSGLMFLSPIPVDPREDPFKRGCSALQSIFASYVFHGPKSDPDFDKYTKRLTSLLPPSPVTNVTVASFETYWEFAKNYTLEYITPVSSLPPIPDKSVGGVPSVLLSRESLQNGDAARAIVKTLRDCLLPTRSCRNIQLFQDITGNLNSPQGKNVSISPLFREAILHVVTGGTNDQMETWYACGSNSYFSESAFDIRKDGHAGGWRNRYWGENYPHLLQIKNAHDPGARFWCRHCVGDGGD